mmetsp:Transcript_70860/g.229825  ORF Transcript_70860/g.229825 Transcript_70860/m.229825 type:complete len:96 (+) Transcript_70860:868-1155(+)
MGLAKAMLTRQDVGESRHVGREVDGRDGNAKCALQGQGACRRQPACLPAATLLTMTMRCRQHVLWAPEPADQAGAREFLDCHVVTTSGQSCMREA